MRLRQCRAALVLATAGGLAMAGGPVYAQTPADSGAGGFSDLLPVVLWTVVTVIVALAVVSIGYLYRRRRGLTHSLPAVPVPIAIVHPEAETEERVPITAHDVEGHAVVAHADAVEQAALLHHD
jgi:hypothetical protein